jgi:FtsH-binding integral membrane protein
MLIFATSLLAGRFFKIPIPDAAIGGVGALLFSIFIIYDTQMIVGGKGKERQLGDKEYIRGAMELYLDITRLFLYVLRMMGKQQLDD